MPVWEIPEGMDFEAAELAMHKLAENVLAQIPNKESLTDEERRVKAGLVSRQVSLR